MRKLTDAAIKYFQETPPQKLQEDWEELKEHNQSKDDVVNSQPIPLFTFCIKANVNWLQYEILGTILNTPFIDDCLKVLEWLVEIGVENKIHNSVPRIGQGNRVVDIADYIKSDFKKFFPDNDITSEIARYCLMGDYTSALNLIKTKNLLNMPLFICAKCGCIENTATSSYWSFKINAEKLQYHPDLEQYRGKCLCSECGTINFRKDENSKTISIVEPGKWHGKFPKEQASNDYKRRVGPDGLIH